MEDKKRKYILRTGLIIALILVSIAIITSVHGNQATSVIIDDGGTTGKYVTIDCLGDNNLLTLYAISNSNPQGVQQFRDDCDNEIEIPKQYMNRAQKLTIRSGEESNTYINYEEFFDEIQSENVLVEKQEYTDKICFTLEMRRYSDVEINGDLTQQVKDFYKCYERGSLESAKDNSNNDDYLLIEIYVDDKMIQEYEIDKVRQPLRISFRDMAILNADFEDKMQVEFQNPINDKLKVSIIDTNLNCEKKSFEMANEYSLVCNKSETLTPNYFMQVEDNQGGLVYEEYRVPPTQEEESRFNTKYILIALGILIVYSLYSKYQKGVDRRDRKAIDDLEKDDL